MTNHEIALDLYSVPPPFPAGGGYGGVGVNFLSNFQKEGVDSTLIFRGGLVRKRGVTFL